MRWGIRCVVLLVACSCGTRTSLPGVSRGSDIDASLPMDAGKDAEAPPDAAEDAAEDAPLDAGPDLECPSALLQGAPTPMAGYCSTRSYQSLAPAPESPTVVWSQTLETLSLPRSMAVDDDGRAYVTYGTPEATIPGANGLAALSPDGSILWSRTLEEGTWLGGPVLAEDGRLVVVESAPSNRYVTWLDPDDGQSMQQLEVPLETRGNPAVGSDGSFYLAVDGLLEDARVMKVTGNEVAWVSVSLGMGLPRLALDGQEHVLFATTENASTTLFSIDGVGQIDWRETLDGQLVYGPAVRNDGAIVMLLARNEMTTSVVVVVESAGTPLAEIDLELVPTSVPKGMALAADDTLVVRTKDTVTALAPGGQVLWERTVHPNTLFDMVIAADETLVLTSGSHYGLDLHTGTQRWKLDPPKGAWCTGVGGLSVDGAFYGVQCDGSVFLASDGSG